MYNQQNIKLDELNNSTIAYLIREWIHSKKVRKILFMKYIDGITYEKISEECDMSVRQVKQITKEGCEYLISKINSTEIASL